MKYVSLLLCFFTLFPVSSPQAAETGALLSGSPLTLSVPRIRFQQTNAPDIVLWANFVHVPTISQSIVFQLGPWGVLADTATMPDEARLSATLQLSIPQIRFGTLRLSAELALTPVNGAPLLVLQRYALLDNTAPSQALENFRSGLASFYNTDGQGHCGFDPSPQDLDVAALTTADGLYGNADWCGACAEVQGPLGSVVVRITDSCPGCGSNQLDLSTQAFAKIANPADGKVNIQWRFVPCATQSNLSYRFKEGSSTYWTAIQVRNHRLPVTKLEWLKNGSWQEAARTDYNYFIEPGGMNASPLRLRITAFGGKVVEDTLAGVMAGKIVDGGSQFNLP